MEALKLMAKQQPQIDQGKGGTEECAKGNSEMMTGMGRSLSPSFPELWMLTSPAALQEMLSFHQHRGSSRMLIPGHGASEDAA